MQALWINSDEKDASDIWENLTCAYRMLKLVSAVKPKSGLARLTSLIYRKNKIQFKTCVLSRCPLAFLLSSNLGTELLAETPRLDAQAALESYRFKQGARD